MKDKIQSQLSAHIITAGVLRKEKEIGVGMVVDDGYTS